MDSNHIIDRFCGLRKLLILQLAEVAKSTKSRHLVQNRYIGGLQKLAEGAAVTTHGVRLTLCCTGRARTVTIPVEKFADWPSFHDTFQCELGFPDFYGRNMNAWIDCMTSVDIPSDGITTLTVQPGEILVFRIDEPFESCRRCPVQYDALVESVAFVNFRRVEIGEFPVLALLLVGKS